MIVEISIRMLHSSFIYKIDTKINILTKMLFYIESSILFNIYRTDGQ